MTITLPGLYVNGNLNSLEFFEFLFDEISAQHRVYKYTSEAVRKDVQQSASTFLDTIVKKGNKQFQPEDIKAPRNTPLPVYIIEILLLVASARYSVLKCLQSLVKKQLYWACKTLISSSQVQDTYLQPEVVTYFTKTILPKTDCGAIPDEVFKKWITNINAVFNFNVLFDFVCDMFNTGSKRKGLEGLALKKKAIILSQTLTESILIHSYGHDRSNVEKYLKAVQEKFPSDTAKKLGIPTTTWEQLEIEFVYKPSFQALEAIRNSMGSQNKVEFLKKQNILIQFLKKNGRFLQEAVIEIFVKREMYKDLLECLNGVTDGYNGYEINFSQINTSLEEVKRMGDKNKAMSLAEALKDYVSSTLVQASFSSSFRQYTKPIPNQVSKCVKMFHSISRVLFMSIIKKAIDTVTEKYLRNTVSYNKREELGRWLMEIKAIFISVHEILEWSVIFKEILQGPLKRKHQIITTLQFWKPCLY
ncbi:uncharacterized protein LOC116289074 [Actinia tenebrosa]|uniref:Uncharacterized protein LOC116289074 n=1 Tax=Actinia tenebrosa TaxID=6105 RepID=A0A6P8H618_ACTTE|nr:uncharacterized protein LOC116289074 [Actinia tenebrosa]